MWRYDYVEISKCGPLVFLDICGDYLRGRTAEFPNRDVRIIVGSQAGGGTDLIARFLAERLRVKWGVAVVVENKSGASGAIASEYVARQPADGYTLLVSFPGTHATAQYLFPSLSYKPFEDFTAVSLIATPPFILVVSSKVPQTIGQFLQEAKTREIAVGTAGLGSIQHITVERFNRELGTKFVPVQYRGNLPALQDVLGGHLPAMISDAGSARRSIQSGETRGLAVTGQTRSSGFPDIPTFVESGFAGFDSGGWFGMWAPKNTPREIREKVAADIRAIVAGTDWQAIMEAQGYTGVGSSPEEFLAFWKQ
jgi:tripartite-type tricarboxylate transporter receptor subunit TctC